MLGRVFLTVAAASAALGPSLAGCAGTSSKDDDGPCEIVAFDDADGDGYGDTDTQHTVCALAAGEVDNSADCNDAEPGVAPGAPEVCNGLDEDCDGIPDNGLRTRAYYPDDDLDGFGYGNGEVLRCERPEGYVDDYTDCDDTNGDVNPSAEELCNTYDDDCDYKVDDLDDDVDAASLTAYYEDDDGDGFGDPNQVVFACDQPGGLHALVAGDCVDSDGDVNPDATEVCNGHDDDCDGDADDNDPDTDPATMTEYFADNDNDGVGDDDSPVYACRLPGDAAAIGGDCDDADRGVTGATTWGPDVDSDLFSGDPVSEVPTCDAPGVGLIRTTELDCDDRDADISPDAFDPCLDGIDQDCDGADDPCAPDCVFTNASYTADLTFQDRQNATTMTMAWNGTSIWSTSGGGQGGMRMSEYTATGQFVQNWATQPDFRSVFTKGDGTATLFARAFNSTDVLRWNGNAFVVDDTLTGATLGAQGVVVWDEFYGHYMASTDIPGQVFVFDEDGARIEERQLAGYSGQETAYPQGRGIALAHGCVLTYYNQTLSSWDIDGNRVDTTQLIGAGTAFDSYFSLSYAQGRAFVIDFAGGTWRGYDVGL